MSRINREWSRRWAACGADFVAIFWCQSKLWEGRQWFDESLKGYEFQQMLVWHANNQCGPKSRSLLERRGIRSSSISKRVESLGDHGWENVVHGVPPA